MIREKRISVYRSACALCMFAGFPSLSFMPWQRTAFFVFIFPLNNLSVCEHVCLQRPRHFQHLHVSFFYWMSTLDPLSHDACIHTSVPYDKRSRQIPKSTPHRIKMSDVSRWNDGLRYFGLLITVRKG